MCEGVSLTLTKEHPINLPSSRASANGNDTWPQSLGCPSVWHVSQLWDTKRGLPDLSWSNASPHPALTSWHTARTSLYLHGCFEPLHVLKNKDQYQASAFVDSNTCYSNFTWPAFISVMTLIILIINHNNLHLLLLLNNYYFILLLHLF